MQPHLAACRDGSRRVFLPNLSGVTVWRAALIKLDLGLEPTLPSLLREKCVAAQIPAARVAVTGTDLAGVPKVGRSSDGRPVLSATGTEP